MKTYDKAIGRLPPEEVKDEEVLPNFKEQWLENKQTQLYIQHLATRRSELLSSVATVAYNTGTVGNKQIAQLIEAETLKLSIETYLK